MITSHQNPKLKHLSKLISTRKYRLQHQAFVLESPLFIKDVLSHSPELVQTVFSSDASLQVSATHLLVEDRLLRPLASGVYQGMYAIVSMPTPSLQILETAKTVLFLDKLQNPSNIGAIARNAAAFDVDAILLSKGCADPYHPESIKASAGHLLSVPIFPNIDSGTPILTRFSWHLLSLNTDQTVASLVIQEPCGFIFGSEGQGTSLDQVSQLSPTLCRIAHHPRVDSLNVAVSSGILLHSLRKQ